MFYQAAIDSWLSSWQGGTLRQETDSSAVVIESCRQCEVVGADIQYKGPPGGPLATPEARLGVRARGAPRGVPGLRLVDLAISGPLSAPVWLAPDAIAETVTLRSVEPLAP
jgi:hypothetical protein